ncbi:MAG TPA: RHS repeat-associated core domain-containing protein, partial [Lachnospiraceae bacterium]|nr:RHS repeat-associated core domain-containing protein [Lachnospiraceae bacterium]
LIHNANGNAWTRTNNYAANNNHLSSTTVGQTTVNYTYNAHGSMTSMPHLQGMQWDFAERLSHITRGTTEAYYNYDGGGQRIRKVVEKSGIVETRLYLGGFEIWRKSVNGVLETERETLHVMDDKKRVAIVETLTIDNAVAVANPVPVQRYQLDNHLASASLELDDLANVINYEEYYPYGDTSYRAGRTASEVSQKRYRYTGKEKDEESGLYYHGARYYACWLGRWTASDPAGLVDGVNLYMYVRGNPVRLSDPSGNAGEMVLDEVEVKGKGPRPVSNVGGSTSNSGSGGTFSLISPEGSPFIAIPHVGKETITGVRFSPNGEAAPADASSVASTKSSRSSKGVLSLLVQNVKKIANTAADKIAEGYFGYAIPAAWPALTNIKTEEQKQYVFKTDAYLTTGILLNEFAQGNGKPVREFKQGVNPFADSVLAGRVESEIINKTYGKIADRNMTYGQWSQTKDTLKFGLSFSPDQTSLKESINKHMNSNLEQLFIGGSVVQVFPGDSNSINGVLINSTSRSSLMLHITNDYTKTGGNDKPLSSVDQKIFFSFDRRH